MDLVSLATSDGTIYMLSADRRQRADWGLQLPVPRIAMLKTCRLINAEATPIFHWSTTFSIYCDGLAEVYEVPSRRAWELDSFPAFKRMRCLEFRQHLALLDAAERARIASQADDVIGCIDSKIDLDSLTVGIHYETSTEPQVYGTS